jgi:hypothetical protein
MAFLLGIFQRHEYFVLINFKTFNEFVYPKKNDWQSGQNLDKNLAQPKYIHCQYVNPMILCQKQIAGIIGIGKQPNPIKKPPFVTHRIHSTHPNSQAN